MLIDSHCHLDYLEREGADLTEVVGRAVRAGVGGMLTIGTKIREADKPVAIAERFANVWASVGIHPHEADKEPATDAARLVELARHPKVIGIGETGLDYFYEHSPRTEQQTSFRAHIQAARETGLPLIVHTRDADDDTVSILREEYGKGAYPGLIHCFTSSIELARAALELGFFISISGIVTFKRAEDLRQAVREIPLERLLVETDSPYLAPVPNRGKSNEPSYVIHTAREVAELKGISADLVAQRTTENFFALFRRADPAQLQAA